ncbi:MAG: hypothetical protein IPM42_20575 [Saprospiraceae bacterium]|nr:hypothetical protein [Saprospiraceae bacterium]
MSLFVQDYISVFDRKNGLETDLIISVCHILLHYFICVEPTALRVILSQRIKIRWYNIGRCYASYKYHNLNKTMY